MEVCLLPLRPQTVEVVNKLRDRLMLEEQNQRLPANEPLQGRGIRSDVQGFSRPR